MLLYLWRYLSPLMAAALTFVFSSVFHSYIFVAHLIFTMCFPLFCCLELASLAPFLLVLLMPLYGSLFGVYPVLRMSLCLYFYAICNCCLSKYLGFVGPCLSGMAFAMVATVQLFVVPTPLLWLYERILWFLEPCLQVVEVMMIISITMAISAAIMEFDFDHPPFGRIVIVILSLVSFTTSPFLFWITQVSGAFSNYTWFVYFVLALCALATLVTLYMDEGIISDAAAVCFTSALVLFVAQWEKSNFESVQEMRLPPLDTRSEDGNSLFATILSMPQVSLKYANQPIELFRKVFSFPFWIMAILRVAGAIWLVFRIFTVKEVPEDDYCFLDSDLEDDEDEGVGSVCTRTLLMFTTRWWGTQNKTSKRFGGLCTLLMAILVYTQIVAVHLSPTWYVDSQMEQHSSAFVDFFNLLPPGSARCAQSVGFSLFYLVRLYSRFRSSDDDYYY